MLNNSLAALSVKDRDCNNSLAASNLKDSVFCNSLSRKIRLSARKDLRSIIKHWRVYGGSQKKKFVMKLLHALSVYVYEQKGYSLNYVSTSHQATLSLSWYQ